MKAQSSILFMLSLLGGLAVAPAQTTHFTYQGRVTSGGNAFNGAGQFKFALVTSTNVSAPATATAILSGSFVVDYAITSGGNGYIAAPAVTISGGGGSGATAHAVVSGGAVIDIVPDAAGSGYTSPPTVTIAPPPPNVSFTTFWSNDGTSVNGSEPVATVTVTVNNGLFTVVLGDTTLANMAAIDAALFSEPKLELRIWFNDGVNGFAALNPPQRLTPAPYAIAAASLSGLLPASQVTGTLSSVNLSGLYSGAVSFNNAGNNFSGAFAGNGGALSNLSANALVAIATNVSITSWGYNQFGQRNVPGGLGDVLAVSAGIAHSLALKPNGTVVAWGGGQTNDPSTSIDRGQSIVPTGLINVVAVAAGYFHSLALRANGTVVAWGDNDSQQTNVPVGLNNVASIAGGAYHSLALKTDGTVVAWGTNSHGQLPIPPGLNNVKSASAGLLHNLVLRSNGTVVAWGNNDYGQTNIPPGLSSVAAISAGGYHNLAIKTDGTVVAWGAGTNNLGTDGQFGQSIVPAGLGSLAAVVAGALHSMVLKTDGTVVAWGDGTYQQTNVPAGLNNILALAPGSGALHALALRKRASAPVAFLDSDNTFNGSVQVNGDLTASGNVTFEGDTRLNDGNLWLRGGGDNKNALGWHGPGKQFGNGTPSGPVLFGESGGALATSGTNGPQTALIWDTSGHVGINAHPSTNATLVIGQPNSILFGNGHGIASSSRLSFHLNQGFGGAGGGAFVFSDAPTGRDLVAISSTYNGFFGVGIGTTTPTVRLDVRGDIKLGSTGQFFASAGTENLRIIRGVVSSTGVKLAGSDFTVSRTSTGVYSLTFSPAFAETPALTANAQTTAPRVVSTPSVTTTGAGIRIFFMDLNPADVQFSFIAIGPR
jgi:hypothetical protein